MKKFFEEFGPAIVLLAIILSMLEAFGIIR
jgi:hypothetical protein